MEIMKFRGAIAAVIAALTLVSVTSFAETPAGSNSPAKGVPSERPVAVQPKGLSNPALKLTDAQKARIDKIVENYLAEQKALSQKQSAAQDVKDARQRTEAAAAARTARTRMTEAVDQVLDPAQRKILSDAQTELHAPTTKPTK